MQLARWGQRWCRASLEYGCPIELWHVCGLCLQLCGMAYPLYIALRRHAVLKHDSRFDEVLYGLEPEEDDEVEPAVECCPYCELVAFTSPQVLQLHLAKIHPDQVQQQAVVAAVAAVALGQNGEDDGDLEDDKTDQDWTENGRPTPVLSGAANAAISQGNLAGASDKRALKGQLLRNDCCFPN